MYSIIKKSKIKDIELRIQKLEELAGLRHKMSYKGDWYTFESNEPIKIHAKPVRNITILQNES